MTTKIELTTLGSSEAQGCGDSCGCGSAKAEPVATPVIIAPASTTPVAVDCRCGNEASACCCADPACC